MTNIFVPIYFDEKILFQKPFEDREIIIKVIETEVIAIKAKDQELSGLIDIIVLSLVFVFFFRKRLEFLINSGILS